MSSPSKRRLGEILMDAGLLDELQLKAALSEQRKWGGKLGRTLIEMGFVKEASMAAALSSQLRLPLIDLDQESLPHDVVQFLRIDIAERYGVFPLGGDNRQHVLKLATADPTNLEALQELGFTTGMRIQPVVASASAIDRAIRRYYYGENVVPSRTATLTELGIPENEYDQHEISRESEVTDRDRRGQSLADRSGELADRLAALERLMASQVRALRGILEVLVEKGIIRREDYLAKVRSPEK